MRQWSKTKLKLRPSLQSPFVPVGPTNPARFPFHFPLPDQILWTALRTKIHENLIQLGTFSFSIDFSNQLPRLPVSTDTSGIAIGSGNDDSGSFHRDEAWTRWMVGVWVRSCEVYGVDGWCEESCCEECGWCDGCELVRYVWMNILWLSLLSRVALMERKRMCAYTWEKKKIC